MLKGPIHHMQSSFYQVRRDGIGHIDVRRKPYEDTLCIWRFPLTKVKRSLRWLYNFAAFR